MVKKSEKNIKDTVIGAALSLSAQQGWAHVTLAGIAREAEMPLPELFDIVEDKGDILALFGRRIDRRVLEAMDNQDTEISARDRIFDILMERYEALNAYRGGLVSILESFCFDPKQAVITCPHLCRSMSWMLESAGIETGGFRGALKVAGLTGLYIKNLRVWKEDESADLAKVMAALDKDLGRAEQFANTFGF